MKKTFLFLAALLTATVMTVQAEVLLDESFNRSLGDLSKGASSSMGTDQADWWYMTGSTDIQVVNNNLTKAGYQSTPSGKAAKMQNSSKRDIRAFNSVSGNGKSVYYSFLLNVDTIKTSTGKQCIIGLTGTTTASSNAAIYGQVRLTYNKYSSYKIGVTKANEVGVRYVPDSIPFDSTILVVVRYDFIEGEKNDECYMWINPTKLDESKPTSWCVQDTASGSGNPWGAKEKVDPSALFTFNLMASTVFYSTFIDEIRVASKWADLFEGAPEEATLKVTPSSTSESYIFQGDSKEYTFEVSGKLLTSDVTISHTNAEVELSTTSLTKEDVMDTTSFKATLTANAAGAQVDTIVLTSGTLVKKIPMAWNTIEVTACTNVAALKAAVEMETEYTKYVRLTGEAIVTRDIINGDYVRELFIEDASGAAKLTDDYGMLDAGSLVGAKIKDLLLLNGPAAWGVQPFMVQGKPTVVSTGNEVEPQVVTIAELQENAADYLYEVVEIQGVTFTNPGGTFSTSSQSAFSQDTKNANVKVENNSLVGVTVPVKANVIGFSFNTSGSVIVPRGKEDIMEIYTRTATAGKFGTICLAKKIADMEGVDGLYQPYEVKDNILYCEEVTEFVAGGAYIFKANAAEVQFTMEGDAVAEPATGNNMKGWLKADTVLSAQFIADHSDFFILGTAQGDTEQKLHKPQATSTLKKNCAMINVNLAPPTAPARGRLVSFGVNTPTGMEQVAGDRLQVAEKRMLNGQLIIMKDGRKFNAQGQEL